MAIDDDAEEILIDLDSNDENSIHGLIRQGRRILQRIQKGNLSPDELEEACQEQADILTCVDLFAAVHEPGDSSNKTETQEASRGILSWSLEIFGGATLLILAARGLGIGRKRT